MYIAISAQKLDSTYNTSVADYVAYLEKENTEESNEISEAFFNQYQDEISAEKVVEDIDKNTAKLKKKEPRFYSIMVSPSAKELMHISNDPSALKKYTRELMKQYASSFHRDRSVNVDDILYYAKIEHQRFYRGFEKPILENAPFRKKIARLKNEIRKIERGELEGNVKLLEKEIYTLTEQAPNKIDGKLLSVGMKKEGLQTHIHIIVSRKDITNSHSLSPGSRYRASKTILNGKEVKRGFNRDQFFAAAEKTFDATFDYKRNLVETYHAKKELIKDPRKLFVQMLGLPTGQRSLAFKMLSRSRYNIPMIPTSKTQLALSTFRKLKKGMKVAIRSSSIGI